MSKVTLVKTEIENLFAWKVDGVKKVCQYPSFPMATERGFLVPPVRECMTNCVHCTMKKYEKPFGDILAEIEITCGSKFLQFNVTEEVTETIVPASSLVH